MLMIDCPWCGNRDESEFMYGGEGNIVTPQDPESISDDSWSDYLFMRKNTKGLYMEQWLHSYGCRRWFLAERETVSYEILNTHKIGEINSESKS